MRPEGEILEHHAKPPALGGHENPRRVVHQRATQGDPSGIRTVQPRDEAQQGGFAGTGFAGKHQELPFRQGKVDTAQHIAPTKAAA